MYSEIMINLDPLETRIAILEQQRLVQLWVERADYGRMVGDVYKGKVEGILPGMQAAFVDIGLERAGFLHISDMKEAQCREEDDPAIQRSTCNRIEHLLKEGQEIQVQVTKEPLRRKGARLTTAVSLPGKFCVLVPDGSVGVSRRIVDEDERERLKEIGARIAPEGFGVILRTMAEGASSADLLEDVRQLHVQWGEMVRRQAGHSAPFLVRKERGLAISVVRDLFGRNIDRLVVDEIDLYKQIVGQLDGSGSSLVDRVEFYDGVVPLFEYFGIEEELDHLFDRMVRLPHGGSLMIEQTEALVVIDVNTGSFSGGHDQEETVFVTNMEAAEEVARQLRLRDLGGIIVIDFIDMESAEHREALMERLKEALKRDRARTRVLPVSEFGLVEMTRERARPSLLEMYFEPCALCAGTGQIMSFLSAAMYLERQLKALCAKSRADTVTIEIAGDLKEYLETSWIERWSGIERQVCPTLIVRDRWDLPKYGFKVIDGYSLFSDQP